MRARWEAPLSLAEAPAPAAARVLRVLLERAIEDTRAQPRELRALDLGAGAGTLGRVLAALGISRIVGVDSHPEAAQIVQRQHPGLYSEYLVFDVKRFTDPRRDLLMDLDLNVLVCANIPGERPLPAVAFSESFNLVAPDALVAFTVAEEHLQRPESFPFARTVTRMQEVGAFAPIFRHRYEEDPRNGSPATHSVAMVGRKVRDFDPA